MGKVDKDIIIIEIVDDNDGIEIVEG